MARRSLYSAAMQRTITTLLAALALCTFDACDKSSEGTTPPEAGDAAATGGDHHADGDEGHHEEGEAHDHGDIEGKPVVAAGEAGIGDVTECPVSGEKFVITEDSPSLEHGGKTFYFCCAGCKGKAEAEPDKFLTAAAE